MNRHEHWNHVYRTKAPEQTSWHQSRPDVSLEMIAASGVAIDAGIIDIGGGTSVLVDHLLDLGYANLAVLDLSAAALTISRERLGARAARVEWYESDVARFEPPRDYALWHDRALFHFLTDADDRRKYLATLRKTLRSGGTVVIATFALDGPPKCSGLDVRRHDERSIAAELGREFELQEVRPEMHVTPWKSEQPFIYCRFRLF